MMMDDVVWVLPWLVYYVWPELDQFLKGKKKFQISAHGSSNQTIYRRMFFFSFLIFIF
jgi:hypothetical protein